MWPSVSSTTPLPMLPPCPERTVMVTTEGEIFSAAAVMVPSRVAGWATGTAVTPGEVEPPYWVAIHV